MRTISEFPHAIREIENLWIPLPDGCRLAARIWLPADAEAVPVPAILEYIPYRKRDGTRARDEPMHRYFAGHGYAAVRVDLRGSGESDGVLLDEYLEQEQDDGLAVIRWLAAQSWCTGAVGMMGKSWGGFNALQVAARRPPELRAVITVCAADDRYADDAHYMGGCLLAENLIWGSVLFTINAQPPDPALVGARWRRMWTERLEHAQLFPELWLRHQRRDEYWRQGSVCETFDAIACPVYAIGGWADGYTNAVPRLLAGLSVPRKGLIGPWAHLYPHRGSPGPAIGFLQEALRWWDHWLKDIDTGIMDEPMYRVWMQESVPPRSSYALRPGRWVAEEGWPSARIERRRWLLAPHGLSVTRAPTAILTIRSPQNTGLAGGAWCSFGLPGELPADQREDDAKSLTFDSEPLGAPMEILGAPVLELELAADRPSALVAVRLNDVAPSGASTRVSYGLLNLTHRDGHAAPQPLEPGRFYRVRVQLNDIAHAFPAGHRIRVAIATSYWPIAWPAPEPVTLTLQTAASTLALPVRPPRAGDEALPPFAVPEAAPADPEVELESEQIERSVTRDLITGETVYTTRLDTDESGVTARSHIGAIDLEVGHGIVERHRIGAEDPLSARAEVVHRAEARRGEWSTRIETRVHLSASRDEFRLRAQLSAYENEQRVFNRRWDRRVPRDGL